MQRAFECRTVPCCRELTRQNKTVQDHCEFVVPDVNEDIGRICHASAQLCLKGKDVTSRGVSISAAADICVYYISESRNTVQCVNTVKDLSFDIDCPLPDCEPTAQVALCCRSIQARAVNQRKLAAELNINVELRCFCSDETAASVSPEGELPVGLQLLEKDEESIIISSVTEKSFVVNEQLTMPPEGTAAVRILHTRAELRHTESQMIGSKALIKGFAYLNISYTAEDAAYPLSFEKSVPFTVLTDSDGEDCFVGDVTLQPTAIYADLTEAVNSVRMAGIELHAVAQLEFLKRQKIEYVSDAYCTRCPAECARESERICTGIEEQSVRAETRDTIAAEPGGGEIISRSAEIVSYSSKDGKLTASVSVSVTVSSGDSMMSSMQKLLFVETPEPSAGFEIRLVSLTGIDAVMENDAIAVRIELEFVCRKSDYRDIEYLTSVELDENNAYDPAQIPSLTAVERNGTDLWTLAKEYHSSVSAIEQLDEKYSHPPEILLIPRV